MSGRLDGRLVGLGITGSIAAYKAAELIRLLRAEGADVQILLTPSAARFVAPLTLAALSGHPVDADILELQPDGRIGHVVIADSADVVIVAPATAHWLGAMAAGLAADPITAACLATSAPVVVAPAMDGEMYAHPATQANVARLRDGFGYAIIEPEWGPLASGQVGRGRLAELPRIVDAAVAAVGDRPVRAPDPSVRPTRLEVEPRDVDLVGRRIVVTAGGTAEPIDPVRYIGNRSTGKMGVAIASAALDRGADVTLIYGMTSVELPEEANLVHAPTAASMREAVLAAVADTDALVMAAAVADFRPREIAQGKIARDGAGLTLALEPTSDILAEAARVARQRPTPPILVGFAAETGSLERASDKAARKGVDLLIANDVAEDGSGFGTDTNHVTLIVPGGTDEEWPLMSKRQVADRLWDRVVNVRADRDRGRAGAGAGAELATR